MAGRTVLHHLSVTLEPGQSIALIGHNGTGKSTLLRCISGQLVPTAGTIRFDGAPIQGLPTDRIVHMGIVQGTGWAPRLPAPVRAREPGSRRFHPGATVWV